MAPKKLTAIRLDEAVYARLEKIGQREERPVSFLIRKAIDQYLERVDPQAPQKAKGK